MVSNELTSLKLLGDPRVRLQVRACRVVRVRSSREMLFVVHFTFVANGRRRGVGARVAEGEAARLDRRGGSRSGELDSAVEGDRVWMACTCGAAIHQALAPLSDESFISRSGIGFLRSH